MFPPGEVRRLYVAFLFDTLRLSRRVRGIDARAVAFTPEDGAPLLRRVLGSQAHGFSFVKQHGHDLGVRLRNALAAGFRNGAGRVVIIGTDSPSLPPRLIEEAFESLDGADVVLGPTTDGGYYLIGVRMPGSTGRLAFLDVGIEWSTGRVLRQTIAAASRAKLRTQLLAPWYDVDEPGDVRFLQTHLAAQRFLKGHAAARRTDAALFGMRFTTDTPQRSPPASRGSRRTGP